MSENTPSQPPENAQKLSPEAASRRLIMLKGLGKGTAVVTAAALPLSTLAQGSTLLVTGTVGGGAPVYRCSVSGMQSSVTSSNMPSDATVCGGYSPGWWGQEEGGVPRRTWPIDYTLKCTDMFPKCTLEDSNKSFMSKSLFDVMRIPSYSSTKTRHWIGAYLNGLVGGAPNFPFPYSGMEVMGFYNLPLGDAKRDKFYELVTTYLERHGGT